MNGDVNMNMEINNKTLIFDDNDDNNDIDVLYNMIQELGYRIDSLDMQIKKIREMVVNENNQ